MHSAESTGPRTNVAQNHEGGGPMPSPALMDIGAAGLFADGVEPAISEPGLETLEFILLRPRGEPHAQPIGFSSGQGHEVIQ